MDPQPPFETAGKRFSDELIAVKLDGSKGVERCAHMHSATSGCYRCEQHPATLTPVRRARQRQLRPPRHGH